MNADPLTWTKCEDKIRESERKRIADALREWAGKDTTDLWSKHARAFAEKIEKGEL
jgi:hypothetical protein